MQHQAIIATPSRLTPLTAIPSTHRGAASLAETTVGRKNNGPISSSCKDTGSNGGRQSYTITPCISEGSWIVKIGRSPTDSPPGRLQLQLGRASMAQRHWVGRNSERLISLNRRTSRRNSRMTYLQRIRPSLTPNCPWGN